MTMTRTGKELVVTKTTTATTMSCYRSKLVQRRISSPADADWAFANITTNSHEGFSEIPIILIPRSRLPFRFAINVPSGPFVMWQKWHRNMGLLNTRNNIWFWPGWCRISHIVTRATISYFAPTRNCLTSDNVFVDVDVSLTFRIGPGSDEVSNFIYKLGVHHFDELLNAEVEQAVRALVCNVAHDQVNELCEEFAATMLSTLASKFSIYGVTILNVLITNVVLPPDILNQLENTTALQLEMAEQEMIHENRLRAVQDEAARSIETLRISNRRKVQQVEAQMKRNDTERLEMEEAARGRARLEEIKAMAEADVALKKCIGDANLEKIRARQHAENILKKSQLQCQAMKIKAEAEVKIELEKSQADLAVAESRAAVMLIKAEAGLNGRSKKLLISANSADEHRSAIIPHV